MVIQQWIIGINLAELQDRVITQSEIIKSFRLVQRGKGCVCDGVTHQSTHLSLHWEKGKEEWKGESHFLSMALWYYFLIKMLAAQLNWDRQTRKSNLWMNYLLSFCWCGTGSCMLIYQADQILCYCSHEPVVLSKVSSSAGQPWETVFLKQKCFLPLNLAT